MIWDGLIIVTAVAENETKKLSFCVISETELSDTHIDVLKFAADVLNTSSVCF